MTVSIPSEFEQFVNAQVASGKYTRPEDVLNDALTLLRDEAELLENIRVGINECERGEIVDFETARLELHAYAESISQRNR